MKKVISFLVCILVAFSMFAKTKVCVIPSNEHLELSLKEYLDVDIVKSNVDCNPSLLLTGDYRLLEYITNSSKADLLLIPIVENISDYNYLRLYSYSNETKEFVLEFETINNNNSVFTFDAIKSIFDHYFYNNDDITDLNNVDRTLIKTYSRNSLLIDCNNTIADIYLNDIYLGKTPYVLSNYYIPSIIKFCSEGFADKVYSINDVNLEELKVTLVSDIKADLNQFKNVQNKYYLSFASFILGWGSRILVSSLNIQNPTVNKILNYSSLGLAISSSAYLGYNIYNYFITTQNTTP